MDEAGGGGQEVALVAKGTGARLCSWSVAPLGNFYVR